MERKLEMRGGGVLTMRQEGTRVCLEAERPPDGRGLYKVWLTGQRGGRMLLGTLAPEGKTLKLRRVVSQGELERAGCWPLVGAEAPLAFSFSNGAGGERWYRESHPERLISDAVLQGQFKGPMLCRKEKEGFRLAYPFRTGAPLALESLFCLARVEQLEGRPHLVWIFDREGHPKIPHKTKSGGQD